MPRARRDALLVLAPFVVPVFWALVLVPLSAWDAAQSPGYMLGTLVTTAALAALTLASWMWLRRRATTRLKARFSAWLLATAVVAAVIAPSQLVQGDAANAVLAAAVVLVALGSAAALARPRRAAVV